jgi:hypothetical protein
MLTKNTHIADFSAPFASKHEALCSKAGAETCNRGTAFCPKRSAPGVGTRLGFKYKIKQFYKTQVALVFSAPPPTILKTKEHKITALSVNLCILQ